MTLEQYAAQQAQNTPQAQETPQENPLDAMAARIEAEKLSILTAEARRAIDEYRSPASILTAITGAVFGESSAEAAAVAQAIREDRAPGGHDLAIAGLRQQRRQLTQQAKQLAEQQKAITEAIEKLNEAERELMREQSEAAQRDSAMIEVMEFCNQLAPRDTLPKEAAEIYEKHHGNPAAMGLLYGSLAELTRRSYGQFDLVQQQEMQQIKEAVLTAIEGHTQK